MHYTLTLTHSQETLSNTLGHQFKLHRLSHHCMCDVCRQTIRNACLMCSRESFHPPLISSLPFPSLSFLLPSSLLLSSFSSVSHPPLPPSSLTECQGAVHTRCVKKLDKTCSEVSEGYMGRKGEGKIKLWWKMKVKECGWEMKVRECR